MRRTIAILGTFLIATILISGSATATWYYIIRVDSCYKCTDEDYAIGSPDGYVATIGENGPPPATGWIMLDFCKGIPMGPDQLFTVYGTSGWGETETYNVKVYDQFSIETDLGSGEDTIDENYTTPSTADRWYRFVKITGTSGSSGGEDGDTIYGPEIDAVGYEAP